MTQSTLELPRPAAHSPIEAPAEEQPKPAKLRCNMEGIKKSFGQNAILKGVDLMIPEGSFCVLVGPSGCGKSTLLRLVAGLEEPDAGTVWLGGKDVTHAPPRDRDVAMVFQSYALYPHLTVRENLAFGLKLRRTDAAEIEKRIAEVSAMLGLEPLLDRLPKQLSGGQRQRVAMGRATVRRAQIFLFDEPLSNLDAALRAEVRVEIRRQHDRLGATTLYVTHDQVEAMTLADTLWVMNKGLVEQKGPPLEVYERPCSKFVATFLGSPQMNLVDTHLRKRNREWFAEGHGVVAPIHEERFAARGSDTLREGRPVIVGLRPHDLAFAETGTREVAKLHVEIVEALGFEAFAHGWVTSGGTRITARLDAETARKVRAGDKLPLTIAASRVHLFDPASERALDVPRS